MDWADELFNMLLVLYDDLADVSIQGVNAYEGTNVSKDDIPGFTMAELGESESGLAGDETFTSSFSHHGCDGC